MTFSSGFLKTAITRKLYRSVREQTYKNTLRKAYAADVSEVRSRGNIGTIDHAFSKHRARAVARRKLNTKKYRDLRRHHMQVAKGVKLNNRRKTKHGKWQSESQRSITTMSLNKILAERKK
jgi:hypothetical protein